MIVWHRVCRSAPRKFVPVNAQRCLSTSALEQRLAQPVQSYISTSRDPYLNLSIEHYLLQNSAPESVLLFLYVNRPSIIIGRNQNPWLEVNLALLNEARGRPETEPLGLGAVNLVRRRSGGGTVFHDEGNVNWAVICPSASFTRDKHAEMVVRGLRGCGVDRARVNERHDVVLDQGERTSNSDDEDTHVTPYMKSNATGPQSLKVSGSAYKLTRNRALHHGTCLSSSPNLNIIPHYLHSSAKPFIKARGVESVSSPVGNTLLGNDEFCDAVQTHFAKLYADGRQARPETIDDEVLGIEAVRNGYDELKSLEWMFLQTPQFSVFNVSDEEAEVDLELTVRHGAFTGGSISGRDGSGSANGVRKLDDHLKGKKLHEIDSWESELGANLSSLRTKDRSHVLEWLQRIFPQISKTT